METPFDFGGEIVWRPSPETLERANLTKFMRHHGIADFAGLLERSTHDVPWFTRSVLDFLDIRFKKPYEAVVNLDRGVQWPAWCVGGRMNIVHNCLDKHIGTGVENRTALIWEGEDGRVETVSIGALHRRVNRCANALRSLGLGKGDAIGVFMPMVPEIAVAVLAIAKIGAVLLPLFSGYGAGAIVSRLADAGARALFTADGFQRRGRAVQMKPIADEAAAQLPALEHMIVVDHLGLEIEMVAGRDHAWLELVEKQQDNAATEDTGAEDLLMVIYTSGTTGRPKGAVHTHCGFPVKSAQDMAFGTDVQAGDVIYWMTDMGWMMGPWLLFGALLLGATFLIYDGAPDHPGPDRLWSLVARHRVNVLGVSPTLIRSLAVHGIEHVRRHDLSSLACFASTGEPWNPEPWMWLFDQVGGRQRPIINYSGGTEISGGILMGNPLLPLKAAAFSAPCPGMAADVLDEQGRSVTGEVGELVIRGPWIGMTRGFWRDPDRYLETYWSRWPDVWVHGDFAARDGDGMWYILGRSDDTIKIAGKRLGPAEVESVVVAHPAVVEAAAIGVPDAVKGSALVLFCVLASGTAGTEDLKLDLRRSVAAALGKPLSPRTILFVSDLPKTRNAKVMRRMVRSAFLGLDPGDMSSLVNPESVEEIGRAASAGSG